MIAYAICLNCPSGASETNGMLRTTCTGAKGLSYRANGILGKFGITGTIPRG